MATSSENKEDVNITSSQKIEPLLYRNGLVQTMCSIKNPRCLLLAHTFTKLMIFVYTGKMYNYLILRNYKPTMNDQSSLDNF